MTFAIAYPVATAGAGAASLAAGLRTLRAQVPPAALMAAAAGCLASILAVDLVPDVRADAGKAHVPSAYLMAAATVALCGLALGQLARRGRGKPGDFGRSVGLPFTAHGLVEGVAVGAVVGWHSAVTPGLLLALVIHKAAEGADLGACLAGSGSSVTTDRRGLRWLAATSAAPLSGLALGCAVSVPETATVIAMVVVCVALGRAVILLMRRAGRHLTVPNTCGIALIAATTMSVALTIA